MEQFEHISVEQTQALLLDKKAQLVDIRDEQSFAAGHIEGAVHLTNGSLQQFMSETEFETPVIVCCYHGISSQQAAQFLIHQGFEQVYSMDGGFEAWKAAMPFVSQEAD
ncbi:MULTISPECIES: thiosulfate sulfurtransferase GlpE [Alteromonadaceae]|uniref:thiosulfate sulfurtransferase GlpE n=1 Tax=Alteromonadaceae TaxID=72275 RepID=UPI001C08DB1B|nr:MULTISPECIES: thiosulfate sulfurtransferase GlpE [Aliiglaciecola]MBU2879081.1 thiosulfate sulfurtransferase GlpE [Aliiglaciecola lipolytica]MDO6710779.1 thiosulfate sulfurtransferase GlpE [Aliiglaciecola sp. 2_MG-2023]MDO6751813.1 thiosulfate sulfurtransferase GlpE [Aliiglaciecola sp. 1_MG-2023]